MANPFDTLRDQVGAALAGVAPTLSIPEGQFENQAAPVYVWSPVGGPLGDPKKSGGTVIKNWQFGISVLCIGETFDQAFRLFQALLTQLRKPASQGGLSGYNFRPTRGMCGESTLMNDGLVIEATIELDFPLEYADIPDPTLTPPQPVTDYAAPTVVIAAVAEDTPATSTPGDGVLEGTEQ